MTKFFKRTQAATSPFLGDASAWHVVRSGAVRITNGARRAGGASVVGDRASGKRKLRCFAAGLRLKVRKRYANESNAFGWWEYRSDQAEGELM
jgi:hypothetical protein